MLKATRIGLGVVCLLLNLAGCYSGDTITPESLTTSPTLSPDTTLEPPHALSIEALRSRSYSGSDFVFEQTLDSGSNYDRYVVSYLSDGLKIYALMTIPWGEKPPTGFPVVLFNHGYIPPDQYRT